MHKFPPNFPRSAVPRCEGAGKEARAKFEQVITCQNKARDYSQF